MDDTELLSERIGVLESQVDAQQKTINDMQDQMKEVLLKLDEKTVGVNSSPRGLTKTISPNNYNHAKTRSEPPKRKPGKLPSLPPATRTSVRNGGKKGSSKEAAYSSENGSVVFYLRGKAISLSVPDKFAESYNIGNALPAPSQTLRMEWVHGYRGKDCRNNIHSLPSGEIAYFVAAVVIMYNPETGVQRHYTEHTDDIKCISLHSDCVHIASGQVAGHGKKDAKPHIRVWSSITLDTIAIFGAGEIDRAACCVSFSPDGKFVAVLDEGNDHVLSIWEWQKQSKVTHQKSSADPVYLLEWKPNGEQLFTGGKNHFAVWSFDKVKEVLSRKMGIYEKNAKSKFVTCLYCAPDGCVITGDTTGNVYFWTDTKITRALSGAHDVGVFSLTMTKNGELITGGKDGLLKLWNRDLSGVQSEQQLDSEYGAIRHLTFRNDGKNMVIGTTMNYILQGVLGADVRELVAGHTEELWGLSELLDNVIVSGGYDGSLIAWNSLSHAVEWRANVNQPIHCLSCHASTIVIGTQDGCVTVFDVETKEVTTAIRQSAEQIECIEFSPCGKYVAAGSRDQMIYIFDVDNNFTVIGVCKGHSSYLTHVDWSRDSQWLRSNSGDYEVLYWCAENATQTFGSRISDVDWHSQFCTIDFHSFGIWPEGADGTDVNGCAASHGGSLIASADDFGKVNLYRYPSNQQRSKCFIANGHSSHVTAVRFAGIDDASLFSTGGQDTAVIQWAVV